MLTIRPVRAALACFALMTSQAGWASSAPGDDVPRTDYLTAAQGAWLTSVSFSGAEKGPLNSRAFETYDGFTTGRVLLDKADPDARIELVYTLPALTTFDRFAVPEVTEVPSGYVTFFREVEVLGSSTSALEGFEPLAKATLKIHPRRGLITDLELVAERPVRYVKLVLQGGIEDDAEKMSYEFSELIGNGTQETVPLEEGFVGIWETKLPDVDRSSGLIELWQNGTVVAGCFVSTTIAGTVSGNILRAKGLSKSNTPSRYVLLLDDNGSLRGTASNNNGPFNLFGGPIAPEGSRTECYDVPEPKLGCGSTVYVQFEFDSADLRPESEPVLGDLFEGLQASKEARIVIQGHTSSEGSEEYNQDLSERRAQAVVDDQVRRGVDEARLTAVGKGELVPIASNSDEAGRSLNRRVEVECGQVDNE